jgi:glycosyltransferase involved in cell wall biosynthesis
MISRKGNISGVIASGVRGDTRRYRTFHLYEQCCILGLNMCLSHVTDPGFREQVEQSDLLVLHRAPWDSNIEHALDSIHRKGGKVIYDTDDLLFDQAVFKHIDSPDFADPVRSALYRDDMARHRRTMEACDVIMTSTQYLADQASKLGIVTIVHRNGFSAEMLALANMTNECPRPENRKTVIGYASGTPTHNHDFEVIGPPLRKTLKENPRASLWLIGPIKLSKDWIDYRAQIIHSPHMPWRLLPAYLSGFDINLAPLVIDNPFSQSKSEIKWMEAALVRTPTIASKTEAYQSAIQSGATGIVATSIGEWWEALTELIGDKDKRQAMGAAGREAAIHSYSPQVRANEFRLVLQQITGRKIPPVTVGNKSSLKKNEGRFHGGYDSRIVARLEKTPSLFTMAGYSLRYRGMSTLIKQIWIFIRRFVSPFIPYKKPQVGR